MYYLNLSLPDHLRYDQRKFFEYDGGYDVFNSYFRQQIRRLPVAGVHTVDLHRHRPDALAEELYGRTDLWWALMEYNALHDYRDLEPGLEVNFFSLTDLDDVYHGLAVRQLQLERVRR